MRTEESCMRIVNADTSIFLFSYNFFFLFKVDSSKNVFFSRFVQVRFVDAVKVKPSLVFLPSFYACALSLALFHYTLSVDKQSMIAKYRHQHQCIRRMRLIATFPFFV